MHQTPLPHYSSFSLLLGGSWLRLVPVVPPDVEAEGRGEADPGEVGQEQEAGRLVDGVELEAAHSHVQPEGGDLQAGELHLVEPKEKRGPGPVQGKLGAVEEEGGGVGPLLAGEYFVSGAQNLP